MPNIFKKLGNYIHNLFKSSPKGNKISVSDLSQQKIKYAEKIETALTNLRLYNSIKKGSVRVIEPKEILENILPKLWVESSLCKTRLALANVGMGINKRISITELKNSQQYRIAYRGHLKEASDFLQKMIIGKSEFNGCCAIGKDKSTIYTKTHLKTLIETLQIPLKKAQEEMDDYNIRTFFLI